jgi:hypothetical protein
MCYGLNVVLKIGFYEPEKPFVMVFVGRIY